MIISLRKDEVHSAAKAAGEGGLQVTTDIQTTKKHLCLKVYQIQKAMLMNCIISKQLKHYSGFGSLIGHLCQYKFTKQRVYETTEA